VSVGLFCVAHLAGAADSLQGSAQPAPLTVQRVSHDIQVLESDSVIERQLSRGDVHVYQLSLKADEYVGVMVEQRGIDVVVQVRGAEGRSIADVQDEVRSRGNERVDVVADVAGTYALAIEAAPGNIVPGSYAIRVLSRHAATDLERSMQEVQTARAAAARLQAQSKFDEARTLLERALSVTEHLHGPDDLQVAGVAAQLAGVFLKLSDLPQSESLYQRALAIMDKTRGAGHPATALVRSRLAAVYQHAGELPKAEALLRQALLIIEKTLGTDHPWYVSGLVTLGNLRDDVGDLEEEEAIDSRALAILERIQDTDSHSYAALLNNLGNLHRQKQDYARAETFLQRALEVGERLEGTGSYDVTIALQNLGIVARARKDYATAETYYARALAVRERAVGPDHPDIAQLLNNQATLYRAMGDAARSLETHLRALRIWESAVGPYHRGTLTSVGNIARTYASVGDLKNAIAFQRRADAILERQLTLNLAVGSERQKLAFVNNASARTDRTISLHLLEAPDDPEAGALAALVLLQRKGRVLDAMTDTFGAVRQRVTNAGDRDLLDQLKTTTSELARLVFSAPEEGRSSGRQRSFAELEARRERLEADLGEHSAEFRAQMQPVALEAVQAAMADDAALVELAVFRPFDPRAERNDDAYGPPHYAAYVVRKHAAPRGHDLGPVDKIDEAIEAFRRALRDPKRPDVKQRARELDEQVMQPLRTSFGSATRLLIAPDGNLNLVPFEALVDEQGRYLIERYSMSYLTSGRDLLHMEATSVIRSKPVIIADPLFGEPPSDAVPGARKLIAYATPPRKAATGEDLSTMYFAPLANTAEEARAIKGLFPDATLLTGSRATKAALERMVAPLMLHIASHGFFLQDPAWDTTPAVPQAGGASATNGSVKTANPLLRSGLALAGANLTGGPGDTGILTALEASGLNLWGTKLVSLSACDSGIGEVRNGEGVYGLRRAFVLAGAETLVMSLWSVSDYVTRETMTAYYTGLRAGLGRGDALRQTKLAMLNRKGWQHPFYWASFIQSGEWTSLDDRR
jgi:CHAT domain-containing protein